MKKTFVNWLGLLGIVAFLSYLAAVVFSPLAYPDYNRLSQAVSDLSASNAPSRVLWGQLSALYDVCSVVCVTLVCIFVKGKFNKNIRIGIYLFMTTCTERQTMNLVGLTITTAKRSYFWTSSAVRSKSRKYWTTWTGNRYEYADGILTALLAMKPCISFQIFRYLNNTQIYSRPNRKLGRRSYGE